MAEKKTAKKSTTTKKSKTTKSAIKKSTPKKSVASKTSQKSKSVAKSVSKKNAPAVASEVSTKKRVVGPLEKLRTMHFSNVLIGVVLSMMAFFMLKTSKIDIFQSYQARDTFTVTDHVTLGPATDVLFSIDLRYMLIAVLLLTSIASLFLAKLVYKRYSSTVEAGISGLRWLMFGVVSAVLVEFVSLLAGVQDVMTLKLAGILVLASAVFGWMSERENANSKKPKKLGLWASSLSMLAAHLPMLISLVSVTWVGSERFSWYVYASVGVLVAGWVLNTWNMRASIIKTDFKYITFEQRYIRIDQIVKLAIVVIVFSVLNK